MRAEMKVMRKKTVIYNGESSQTGANLSYSLIPQTSVVPSFSYLPIEYSKSLESAGSILGIMDDKPVAVRKISKSVPSRVMTASEIMCEILIEVSSSGDFRQKKDHSYPESFYSRCVTLYETRTGKTEDRELCIIHAKQMMIILRKCGIIPSNRTVSSRETLYRIAFDSFWNHTDWSDLFPSMPETATLLQDDRYLLAELLLSRKGVFCIDDIARDYFTGAGVSPKQMLLYISFFDFSVLSWMRNFGIVADCKSKDGRVKAKITEWGSYFLNRLE